MSNFYAWCKRYLSLTLLASLVIGSLVLFFNENSLLRTVEQERRITELEASISEATDTTTITATSTTPLTPTKRQWSA